MECTKDFKFKLTLDEEEAHQLKELLGRSILGKDVLLGELYAFLDRNLKD